MPSRPKLCRYRSRIRKRWRCRLRRQRVCATSRRPRPRPRPRSAPVARGPGRPYDGYRGDTRRWPSPRRCVEPTPLRSRARDRSRRVRPPTPSRLRGRPEPAKCTELSMAPKLTRICITSLCTVNARTTLSANMCKGCTARHAKDVGSRSSRRARGCMKPKRCLHDVGLTNGSAADDAGDLDTPVSTESVAAWNSASSLAVAGLDAGGATRGARGSGDVRYRRSPLISTRPSLRSRPRAASSRGSRSSG